MPAVGIKELKPNGFVVIDGVPCRVDKIQVSTSGKHGHAKVRIEAVGLFDGVRHSILGPAHETVEVPIVEKKRGQVLALLGENKAQIMDMNDFSVFELDIPEERREEIKQGAEIDYFTVLDLKTLKELK